MRNLAYFLAIIFFVCCMTSCGGKKNLPVPVLEENPSIHTAEKGVAVIKPDGKKKPDDAEKISITPETVWEESLVEDDSFTVPTEEIIMEDGSLGTLSISSIDLQMSVFESDNTIETMKKGAAHFKSTSMWVGNVGLSAHNGGVPDAVSFGRLHEMKNGDSVIYTTEFGERRYEVCEIKEISDDDWSYLSRTEDNRITLITCVNGKPDKRLMVQAVEA